LIHECPIHCILSMSKGLRSTHQWGGGCFGICPGNTIVTSSVDYIKPDGEPGTDPGRG